MSSPDEKAGTYKNEPMKRKERSGRIIRAVWRGLLFMTVLSGYLFENAILFLRKGLFIHVCMLTVIVKL